MIIKEIFSKFKDKLHFFRIPGVFQDQGHFQGLFKICANPVKELPSKGNRDMEGTQNSKLKLVTFSSDLDLWGAWLSDKILEMEAFLLFCLSFQKELTLEGKNLLL